MDSYSNNLKVLSVRLLMVFPTCSLEASVLGHLGRDGPHFAGESNLMQGGSFLWVPQRTLLMESAFSAALW